MSKSDFYFDTMQTGGEMSERWDVCKLLINVCINSADAETQLHYTKDKSINVNFRECYGNWLNEITAK